MIAKERLYLTADRNRVVRHGDREAAFLLAGVGGVIDDREAARLGLLDPPKPAPEPPPPPKPEPIIPSPPMAPKPTKPTPPTPKGS